MPYLERTVSFSAVQLSSLVAAAMVGSVVMTPLAGLLVEWIGRRRAIGWSALLFAFGAFVACLSDGCYRIPLAGLLVQGLAMGGCPQAAVLTGKNRYNNKQQSAKAEKGIAKL